jgi:hypothetical protein
MGGTPEILEESLHVQTKFMQGRNVLLQNHIKAGAECLIDRMYYDGI